MTPIQVGRKGNYTDDLNHQVFALSIDQKVLGGNLWWIFMAVVSIVSAFVALLLEDKSRSATAFEMASVGESAEVTRPLNRNSSETQA